jgi:hypothetical protein
MVFDRNRLGRVALLSGIAYLGLSTFSASEDADVTSGQADVRRLRAVKHSWLCSAVDVGFLVQNDVQQ